MNYIELAKQAGARESSDPAEYDVLKITDRSLQTFAALVAAAARADERNLIAAKWETWYGYDKQGVAEFIRKRANTQGEQHDRI